MKRWLKLLSTAMLVMLAFSTVSAAFTASADDSGNLCKCEKFAKDNDIRRISVDNISLAFCDPRSCSTKGTCCIDTFSPIFCPSMLSRVVCPDRVLCDQNLALSVNFNVPDGATGIFQTFLPTGFTFVADTFFVDGVAFTPVLTDSIIELRDITPGLHTITFSVLPSITTVEFQAISFARAFAISGGFINTFSQASFLTTVLPVAVDGEDCCEVDDKCEVDDCNDDCVDDCKADCEVDDDCKADESCADECSVDDCETDDCVIEDSEVDGCEIDGCCDPCDCRADCPCCTCGTC